MRASIPLCVALSIFGCQKSEEPTGGLPAAGDWTVPDDSAASSVSSASNAGAAQRQQAWSKSQAPGNPHAGLDIPNPHAGLDTSNPHAGLDLGNPHGAQNGESGDPDMEAFDPPDPNRAIDPSKYVSGLISVMPDFQESIKSGSVVFLSVRPINAATGEKIGSPIAVDIKTELKWPIAFHLSGENSMVAGTGFEGDVEVYARIDGDGEARTKEPGDIDGTVRAKIPQKSLKLVLNNRLR